MTEARVINPVIFFGTDEFKPVTEGAKDFRPIAGSYEKAQVEAEKVAVEAPKVPSPLTKEETKELHPSTSDIKEEQTNQVEMTTVTIHPDLEF